MLDHITITVSNLVQARAFYDAPLAPLNVARVYDGEATFSGYGTSEKTFFWIGEKPQEAISGAHIAFTADSRRAVDEFYTLAMAAGGRCNGAPGLRPHYHEDYYGAFVLDPDGHNIEAVCHQPEG